jgi:hypothetical protein
VKVVAKVATRVKMHGTIEIYDALEIRFIKATQVNPVIKIPPIFTSCGTKE